MQNVKVAQISTGTNTIGNVNTRTAIGTSVAYRTGVTAADLMAAPGTVTTSKQAGGSCGAGTYNVKVVAGNTHGRTTATAGSGAITTETTNLTVRALFAAVTGATFYDIYCSTEADPKWVGRITEAQRASGIKITAVGVTGAGGAAGGVDVEVVGTGLASGTTCAVNTAYVVPANPVTASNYQYLDFQLYMTRTGDAVAPALVVVPMYSDATEGGYFAGDPVTLAFGGTTGATKSLRQLLRVEARGHASVALCVASIAGTGASLSIWANCS